MGMISISDLLLDWFGVRTEGRPKQGIRQAATVSEISSIFESDARRQQPQSTFFRGPN
jgi:hypothetical protein